MAIRYKRDLIAILMAMLSAYLFPELELKIIKIALIVALIFGVIVLLGILYIILFSYSIWLILVVSLYPFSKGIGPSGISSNAFKLCRLNDEVREALGSPVELQYSGVIEEGVLWKLWKFIAPFLFRLLKVRGFCPRCSPAGPYTFHWWECFVIVGPFQKGVVRWEARAMGAGMWVYTSLTVDVMGEDGASIKTIHVPIPEKGFINDGPMIEVV